MSSVLLKYRGVFEFPSPFGVRVLKCLLCTFIQIRHQGCFRPLSGFVFWNLSRRLMKYCKEIGFPSPFGVRVLKLAKVADRYDVCVIEFPSPFGVRVLKCT